MSAFFSNEAVSLEKEAKCVNISTTNEEEIDELYEIQRCVKWIQTNGFKNVCLQFPDSLLPDSTFVSLRLQALLGQHVFIMADTAYESCCIDYLTAAHVNAEAIIHFGPVCFSKELETIPSLKIFEKKHFNVDHFVHTFKEFNKEIYVDVVILVDTPYLFKLGEIRNKVVFIKNVPVEDVTKINLVKFNSSKVIFVSDNLRKLEVFTQTLTESEVFHYNPSDVEKAKIINFKQDLRLIKRRNYLVEKIRDSRTVGILIGTLAIKNYFKIIERMKYLMKNKNKKFYVISVGKPNVAKLANFPEIELFVLISCAMNELFGSRDFYQPIVSPHDVEVAINTSFTHLPVSVDFNSYFNACDLPKPPHIVRMLSSENSSDEPDVSLLSGRIRANALPEDTGSCDENDQVALPSDKTVALNSHYGAGYLSERSWRGLENNMGGDEPVLAVKGRKGIAMAYENEN